MSNFLIEILDARKYEEEFRQDFIFPMLPWPKYKRQRRPPPTQPRHLDPLVQRATTNMPTTKNPTLVTHFDQWVREILG